MWVGYNLGCIMGFLMGHSAWQIDQFPTCWPMNGLFVHWSRGWGVSSFSERLVVFLFWYLFFLKLIVACRLCVIYVREVWVGVGAFLRWWPPSTTWAGPLIYLWPPPGDDWIIPSFRIWDYVLHVEHISCVITNCGQHQWVIPSPLSIGL